MKIKQLLFLTLVTLFFASCGNSSNRGFQKSPLDVVIKELYNEPNFTVILFDMDYDEATDSYRHQYNILIPKKDTVLSKQTSWFAVSDLEFEKQQNNMGMEIASKKNGVVSKTVSPAGYSNYVGNERYGRWTERNGSSFWEFYGKYAFLSSMFRMTMYPVHYSYYDSYRGYYRRGMSYYGPTYNGRAMYGTGSAYSSSNTRSKWNSKPTGFKDKVRSKVKRSASKTRSSIFKTSRSSSRYSRSSTRSRSRGFGK